MNMKEELDKYAQLKMENTNTTWESYVDMAVEYMRDEETTWENAVRCFRTEMEEISEIIWNLNK